MNNIKLKGYIKNIEPSHTIDGIQFDKADLLVKRNDGKEDIINIKFKKFTNKYNENELVFLSGNLRTYSYKVKDNKNKVNVYVFTYFDVPEEDCNNEVIVDGRICKIDSLRTTRKGKKNIHFILANNIISETSNRRLNSYIPCIAWKKVANEISKLHVNDKIKIHGELHSREHKKILDNGEYEICIAHELLVKDFEVID